MRRVSRSEIIRHWRTLDYPHGRRRHNYVPELGNYDPAMSFEEIGRRLGIGKQLAYHEFVNGIRKLRRNPSALFGLLATADIMVEERAKREEGGRRISHDSIHFY